MKKIEHFKSMANQMATADEVVNDILDPNPEPAVSKDRMPVNEEHVLHKSKGMTPNTWFHYDHPEHGKIEVSAHHDGKQVHILGVGAGGGDPHVHPEKDAGIDKDHLRAMASHALKLGPGRHLNKSEESALEPLEKAERNHEAEAERHSRMADHFHERAKKAGSMKDFEDAIEFRDYHTRLANMHHFLHQGDHEMADKYKEEHSKYRNPYRHIKGAKGTSDMKKTEYTAEDIVLQALKNVKAKVDLKKGEAKEMKRPRDAEDTGSIYNEEQEVGNQNDIQEAAKREHARANGKKLKEYIEKQKNKSEKKAKSPIEDK